MRSTNNNNAGAAGGGNIDRRARLREQMKEFYGDPTTSTTRREVSPQKAGVAREMDLDSEYFNVSRYTTDLLRKESLKGLVEADTELLRRVRRLDSELQELVYRNYAKFISATDTIREMHNNISEMDTKLQALTSNVSNIDQVSHHITGTLHEHRNKIEETVKVNRLMKKAQFLVGLPAMMRQLMDKKDYSTCVKYWVAGDGFLEKHNAIPSIQKVHKDCRVLSKELYTKIEDVMCAFPLDDPEAMDNIRKFVEDLRLLRATSLSAEMKSEDGTFEDTVLRALMRSVSANFSQGIAAVQRDTKAALALPNFTEIEYAKRDEPLANANLREALAQLKSVCALLSVNSERVYALLNREGAGVAMRVAQEVQPMLVDLLAPVSELMGSLAVAACCAAAEEAGAHMLSKDRHDTVPQVLSNVANALARQLKNFSVTLKTLGAIYLDTAHSQQSKAYSIFVDKAVCDILLQCVHLFHDKAQQQPSAAALAAVSEPLRRDNMLVVQSPESKARHEKHAFCLSRYAYGSLAANLADVVQTVLVDGDALAPESAKDLSTSIHEAAKRLQHRAVVLLGQVGVAAVEDLFRSNATPYNAVSERMRDLVADWSTIAEAVEGLVPPQPLAVARRTKSTVVSHMEPLGTASYNSRAYGGGSSVGRSSDHHPRSGRLQVHYTRRELASLQSNVAQLFSNQDQVYHTMPTDGRPATTVACIVLYELKALVETVRQVYAFDENSFNRVQVHCTYLLRAVLSPPKGSPGRTWLKAWEDSVSTEVQKQLDEVCTCAYERCETKVPLSYTVLESIVEEGRGGAGAAAADDDDEPTADTKPRIPEPATRPAPTAAPPAAAALAAVQRTSPAAALPAPVPVRPTSSVVPPGTTTAATTSAAASAPRPTNFSPAPVAAARPTPATVAPAPVQRPPPIITTPAAPAPVQRPVAAAAAPAAEQVRKSSTSEREQRRRMDDDEELPM